jgi:Tfp pilus assembly protein PilX
MTPQPNASTGDARQAGTTAGRRRADQRGVVLLYALIALVLLMISGLALVRGMRTSLLIGGDFALRRDLINQGEFGVASAEAMFESGGALGTSTARTASVSAANYSATILPTEPSGIPIALLSDSAFGSVGVATNDISGTLGISIRYVIDRQCASAGDPSTSNCMSFQTPCKAGAVGCGGHQQGGGAGRPLQAVYRITVRVTGPQNTMTFLQTTIGS